LLEQSEVDPLVEISAFQVAALLGETGVLARAIEVAEAGPTVASRVAAVAAVRAVGDIDALWRLKRLLDDSNSSVRNAARAAIVRLESSHGG
jgi:HEAT repeat protein